MLSDNDRALLQLVVDNLVTGVDFELRLVARSLLAVDAELRELRGRLATALPLVSADLP